MAGLRFTGGIYTMVLLSLFFVNTAYSKDPGGDISKNKYQVAISGYDPTAYFFEHKAMQGSSEFQYQWGGAIWYFVSAEAKKRFIKEPAKYAPQYGGYCSNGLSDGHKVAADPRNWRIIDSKLYLYFSQYGRSQWSGNVKPLIESAEKTWNDLQEQ